MIINILKGIRYFYCKEHRTELFQLEDKVKMQFLEEMSLVAEAVSSAFGAEKMNYELLGNGDTHLHWHLFPRIAGDLEQYGSNGKRTSMVVSYGKKCTVRKIVLQSRN